MSNKLNKETKELAAGFALALFLTIIFYAIAYYLGAVIGYLLNWANISGVPI